MKEYKFSLDAILVRQLFSSPIRSKSDVIGLLMKSIRRMLLGDLGIGEKDVCGSMILKVSKMSRIFYFIEGKYFSINFPFFVREEDGNLVVGSSWIDVVDNAVVSSVIEVISTYKALDSICALEFAEKVMDSQNYTNDFWVFLRELLIFEDGYIRYDHDPERENGHLHPLNHLDIFYSNSATFKIGLAKDARDFNLIDLLDLTSNCHYLQSPGS